MRKLIWLAYCLPLSLLQAEPLTDAEAAALVNDAVVKDVEKHNKGEYPELRTTGTSSGQIQHAWDTAPAASGVEVIEYNPLEPVRLRLRQNAHTTIVFPEWENITTIEAGDQECFQLKKLNTHVLGVQPQAMIGVDTTISVIGLAGVYSFYLRSEGWNSKHIPHVKVYIRTPKPKDLIEKIASTSPNSTQPAVDYLKTATQVMPEELNFAWTMRAKNPAARTVAPERVYSDKRRVYCDWGARWDQVKMPKVFEVEGGIETPVPYRVKGTMMIITSSSPLLSLQVGSHQVCLQRLR